MATGNKPSVKFVILSLEESSDLDNTAAKCLLALYKRLENNGQPLMLVRGKGAVRDLLAHLVPNELDRKKTMLWGAEDAVAFSISQQPLKTNLPWLTAMANFYTTTLKVY